jgi:hypothetical protein
MGQQQLLLIILGVIIVGIAVAVGITMFQDNALSANKDALTNDLVNLAAKSQQYYRKPAALGGGGNSFAGITHISQLVSEAFYRNDNGEYAILASGSTLISFVAVGKTQDSNGSYPIVTYTVTPTTFGLASGTSWGTTGSLIY